MPFYELMLVIKPVPKNELLDCLKRSANLIWKERGVLRKIDYMGFQKLPYMARGEEEGSRIKEGSYFLYHVSLPTKSLSELRNEFKLDVDIVKASMNLANESVIPEDYECTLEEELQTPFYRKSVQPFLENKNVRADVRR